MDRTANRKGDWCQTYRGGLFWPLDPRADEVDPLDIAHALSLMCRFNGHCLRFYSVAEHSVRVSEETAKYVGGQQDRWVQLAGLLHDAAEAYVADIVRPLKRFLPGYGEIENRVQAAVWQRFGVPVDAQVSSVVKKCDNILLATEARDLMAPPPVAWHLDEKPSKRTIRPWSPAEAEHSFLARLAELWPEGA